ncbi:MAG: GxxExxY protein [Verrucomicrobiales bacterium]|nr:GxxExxY protein [Verrucomicrobiales bacterium]
MAHEEANTLIAAKERRERKKMDKSVKELCNLIRQIAYDIHVYHGHGHVEKIYENALIHRLRKSGVKVEQQFPLKVYDEDETLLGEFFVDLLVENKLIVELKAVRALASEHLAQLLGYLKSARCEHGLLVNFGSYKFEIKKYALSDARLSQIKTAAALRSLRSFAAI